MYGKRNDTGNMTLAHEAFIDGQKVDFTARMREHADNSDVLVGMVPYGKHRGRIIFVKMEGLENFLNNSELAAYRGFGDIFMVPKQINDSTAGDVVAYPADSADLALPFSLPNRN